MPFAGINIGAVPAAAVAAFEFGGKWLAVLLIATAIIVGQVGGKRKCRCN